MLAVGSGGAFRLPAPETIQTISPTRPPLQGAQISAKLAINPLPDSQPPPSLHTLDAKINVAQLVISLVLSVLSCLCFRATHLCRIISLLDIIVCLEWFWHKVGNGLIRLPSAEGPREKMDYAALGF